MALNDQVATNVGPSGIEVAYERRGNPADPVVLLIMGGAAQLVHWPEGLLAALLRRGLQLIRFDNRDAGRSTHFHEGPKPDVPAALAGDFSSAAHRGHCVAGCPGRFPQLADRHRVIWSALS